MTIVRPGMLVRHHNSPKSDAGTIGAIVVCSDAPEKTYIISCSHVLAPLAHEPLDGHDKILSGEGGDKAVGVLIGHSLKRANQNEDQPIDVGVAEIDRANAVANPEISGIGAIAGIARFRPVGLTVHAKGGNDEGLAKGKITGETSRRIVVNAQHKNQFGEPGDSGAFALNRFGCAVGMITGRTEGTSTRFVMPIEMVLREAERIAGFSSGSLSLFRHPDFSHPEPDYDLGTGLRPGV